MFILLRNIDFIGRRIVLQLDGTMSVDTVAQLGQYLRYCLEHGYQDVELSHQTTPSAELEALMAQLREHYNVRITYVRTVDTDDTAEDGSPFVSRVRGSSLDYRMSIDSFKNAVSRISDFVLLVGYANQLSPMLITTIRLGLTELMANSIDHAKYGDTSPHAEVLLTIDPRWVTSVYTDNGHEFDSSHTPDIDIRALMNDSGTRGLGLYMLRTMTDDISYARVGGRNRTTFKLKLEALEVPLGES